MHSLHVVVKVVASGETIASEPTLTSRVEAEVRTVAVTVHAMCLALVAEQAGRRRELLLGAGLDLAAERLEVRVDELAIRVKLDQYGYGEHEGGRSRVHTHSCT